MRVYAKVVSLVGLALAVMLFATLFLAQNVLTKDLLRTEQNEKIDQLKLAKAEIEYRYSSLDVITATLAAWDESYQFMLDRNQQYYNSNVVDQTFRSLDVNVMAYYDENGTLVIGKAFNIGMNKSILLPRELRELDKGSVLLQDGANGLAIISGKPYVVSSHYILRSDGTGPPRGTLIMARELDSADMFSMQKMAGYRISGYWYYNNSMPGDFLVARANLESDQATDYYYPEQESHDVLSAYELIRGVDGKPAMIIRIDSLRTAYNDYKQSLMYLIITYLIMGVVAITVLIVVMDKVVLIRLKKLSEYAKNAGNIHAPEEELSLGTQKDEISELFAAVAEMNKRHRKDAEGIEKEKMKYEELVEKIPLPTIVFYEGNIIFANQAVKKTGYEPSEVEGLNIYSFVFGNDKNKRPVKHAWKDGGRWTLKAVPLRYKNGEMRLVDLNQTDILFEGKKATLSVAVDVTDKIRARAVLRQNARKLEEQVKKRTQQWEAENGKVIELLKVKDNFIREISHELKTPLSVISGNIELLKDFKPAEKRKKYNLMVGLVKRNTDRLRVAVSHILDANKITTAKISREKFDLAKLVRLVYLEQMPEANAKGLKYTMSGKKVMVRADRKMLALAINSMVSNAVRFTRKGKVSVSVYEREGKAYVRVSDSAGGMSRETRGKICRGEEIEKGVGEGISFVESIMLKHNGQVIVRNKKGKGSTFILRIPLRGGAQ